MVEIGVEAMANPLVSIGLVVVSGLAGFSIYWLRRFVGQVENISDKLENVCTQISELTTDVRIIIERNVISETKIDKLGVSVEMLSNVVSGHTTDITLQKQKINDIEKNLYKKI